MIVVVGASSDADLEQTSIYKYILDGGFRNQVRKFNQKGQSTFMAIKIKSPSHALGTHDHMERGACRVTT